MFWAFGFVILLIALLIPILAVVLDAPVFRRWTDARLRSSDQLEELTKRVLTLEDEVEELGRAVAGLRDETQFLQHLLEHPERPEPPDRLAPPQS